MGVVLAIGSVIGIVGGTVGILTGWLSWLDRRTRLSVSGVLYFDMGDAGVRFACAGRVVNRSRHPVRVRAAGFSALGLTQGDKSVPEVVEPGDSFVVYERNARDLRSLGKGLICEMPARYWVQLADGTAFWSKPGFVFEDRLAPGLDRGVVGDLRYYHSARWWEPALPFLVGVDRARVRGAEPVMIIDGSSGSPKD